MSSPSKYKSISKVDTSVFDLKEPVVLTSSGVHIVPDSISDSFHKENPDVVYFTHYEINHFMKKGIDAATLSSLLMIKKVFHPAEVFDWIEYKPVDLDY